MKSNFKKKDFKCSKCKNMDIKNKDTFDSLLYKFLFL